VVEVVEGTWFLTALPLTKPVLISTCTMPDLVGSSTGHVDAVPIGAEVLTRNRDPVLQDNSLKERLLLGEPVVCAVGYVVPLKRCSSKH
jgi:hypothetical protein